MAIAVTFDGHPFYFNYEVASIEKKTPVSEATLFEIGSVSKTYTATLASYAHVLGKLSFDAHPGAYLRQLRGSAIDKASVLNLGTYTAGGLPLQFPDQVSNDQMITYFRQWKPAAGPGTQRTYSNPSLGLFGYITGVALKQDFVTAVESHLLPALGLTHSFINVPDSAMPDYAWGYNDTDTAVRMNPGVLAAETYGMKSTATDMLRFVQINMTPELLGGSLRRAVEETHVGYFQVGGMVQGLGWEQYRYPISLDALLAGNSEAMIWESNAVIRLSPPRVPIGPTLFDKTGSTAGFGSYVAFVPAQKLGIVILANRNYPIPARVAAAHAILEKLADVPR